jgi:hypothetical protein
MTATRRPRRPGPGWARTAPRRAISTIRYVNDELMRANEAIFRPAGAAGQRLSRRPPAPAKAGAGGVDRAA